MQELIEAIDKLIIDTRLQDIRMIACMQSDERIARLGASLSQLPEGAYLLGCGPYNTGLIKIGTTDIVLGRQPSPIEDIPDGVADYLINDAVHLTPREVSRNHATIRMDSEDGKIYLSDNGSSTGTWLNGQELDSVGIEVEIDAGSIVSLGSSLVNAYICFIIST